MSKPGYELIVVVCFSRIVLLNYREKLDKKTGNMVEIPYMILWKHGLKEEAF